MTDSASSSRFVRFGSFALDLQNEDLLRDGARLKLQPQPAKVLAVLVSRAGELVTRRELAKQVWGSETFVDYEQGLNFAIRQIRTVLDDDADQPRFIETIPKRGYRFIALVNSPEFAPDPRAIAGQLTAPSPIPRRQRSLKKFWAGIAALSVGIAASAGYFFVHRAHPQAAVRPIVLAVLPFDDLSTNPQAFLVDGLTEEMIARGTQINPEQLKIVARTSAMQYQRTKKSARQIGQELGADYVLENSIRREGERLRITSQLVRTSDQTHLWAENYDRDVREVLSLESEVTSTIAEQVHRQLFPVTTFHPFPTRPINPEARELYLRARYAFNQRTREQLQQSVALYQQALLKQTDYPDAYAGLADSYNLIAYYGFDPSMEAVTLAKINAQNALRLDERSAEAHAALAYTDFMWQEDWPAAQTEFRRALELDDNYIPAHQWYAFYLAANGKTDEALTAMRYAQKLDPLSATVQAGTAYLYYFSRDYDLAVQHATTALQLNPNSMAAHAILGWAYTEQKKFPAAIRELQTAVKLSGNVPVYLCALARAYAFSGDTGKAYELLAQVELLQKQARGTGSALASVYVALGDPEKAMKWLENTAPGDIQANWLLVDPAFDALRHDRRFSAILVRIQSPKQPH